MEEIPALLARVRQIATQSRPRDECVRQALDLLHAYTARLYAGLNIGASNPLDAQIKARADRALAELRGKVLTAEVGAAEPAAAVFTALRHRLDMARRILALRTVADDETVPPARQDWELIWALRVRFNDRRQIARSKAALENSVNLFHGSARVLASTLIVRPKT